MRSIEVLLNSFLFRGETGLESVVGSAHIEREEDDIEDEPG